MSSGSSNPLVALGEKLFRFSVTYSVVATLLSIMLATAGQQVPDVLNMTPFNATAVGSTLSQLSGQPIPAAIAGVALSAAYALSNIFIGSLVAVPRLVEALVSAVSPSLIPVARFLYGVCGAAVLLYLSSVLLGGK